MNSKWLRAALCPTLLSQEIKTVMTERIQLKSYLILKLGQYSMCNILKNLISVHLFFFVFFVVVIVVVCLFVCTAAISE